MAIISTTATIVAYDFMKKSVMQNMQKPYVCSFRFDG